MPHYSEVIYWHQTYANSGILDKRAVETFMDCETAERVNSLRAQLYAIAQGKYDEALFIKQLGPERRQRHSSYQEWAKMMLQWMGGYKS